MAEKQHFRVVQANHLYDLQAELNEVAALGKVVNIQVVRIGPDHPSLPSHAAIIEYVTEEPDHE